MEIYQSTNGPGWLNSSGWLEGDPCGMNTILPYILTTTTRRTDSRFRAVTDREDPHNFEPGAVGHLLITCLLMYVSPLKR